jgi:hypothetical protein
VAQVVNGVAQVVECLPSKCEALSSNDKKTKTLGTDKQVVAELASSE